MTLSNLRLLLTACAAATAFGTAVPALADGPSGEMLASTCAGCHGTDGASLGPAAPTIAALSTDYFVLSMKDFQTGKRPSTVMGRIAKGYTDDQIKAMAVFFQSKPFVRTGQPVDAAKAKEGKALAKKFCESCHEDEGRIGEGVGVLAGQWLPYMEFSVADFRAGTREMEKRQAKKFEELAEAHGDAGFSAILHYYASVK
ncbi:c-type cytochrome [Azospirillum halopraeferens]|uniref:c-type cytochrome n=1 Tax=Azospirillum halopraeferens TaxID=34010 RepID=UPI00040E1C78|nr:c-type cytochrome [Azospirillum halopraeferens]